MKKELLVSILFILISSLKAQTLYIIHKKGKLFNQLSGKEILQGDVIKQTDKIRFADKSCFAIVISTKIGRYTLKPKSAESISELNYIVSQVLLPVSQADGLNTRSFGKEETVANLHSYFGKGSFLFWEDIHSIKLDKKRYELSDNHYFIYMYHYNSKDVKKKIGWENNQLMINSKALYSSIPEYITKDSLPIVKIYYLKGSKENIEEIASFKPVFKERKELVEELTVLYNVYKNEKLDKPSIEKKITEYINSIYGKCDNSMLETILLDICK